MSSKELIGALTAFGVTDKAAKLYLIALTTGETTVLDLAKKSGIPRTTIYYVLEELFQKGMLHEVVRGKKSYVMYVEPEVVIKNARQKIIALDEVAEKLEELKYVERRQPRVEFYFGPAGFRDVWFKVFNSGVKEFYIITDAESFLGYVKENYVTDEIILEKKKRNIKSKQLIVDSKYARGVIVKDQEENRVSKLLPPEYKFTFTEIITDQFVVFISSRHDNVIFTVEQPNFAETRKKLFEALWDNL